MPDLFGRTIPLPGAYQLSLTWGSPAQTLVIEDILADLLPTIGFGRAQSVALSGARETLTWRKDDILQVTTGTLSETTLAALRAWVEDWGRLGKPTRLRLEPWASVWMFSQRRAQDQNGLTLSGTPFWWTTPEGDGLWIASGRQHSVATAQASASPPTGYDDVIAPSGILVLRMFVMQGGGSNRTVFRLGASNDAQQIVLMWDNPTQRVWIDLVSRGLTRRVAVSGVNVLSYSLLECVIRLRGPTTEFWNFETGTEGWGNYNAGAVSQNTTDAAVGTACLEIVVSNNTGLAGGQAPLTNPNRLTPGRTWSLSAFVKGVSGTVPIAFSHQSGLGAETALSFNANAPNGVWQRAINTTTLNGRANALFCWTSASSATWRLDAVAFTEYGEDGPDFWLRLNRGSWLTGTLDTGTSPIASFPEVLPTPLTFLDSGGSPDGLVVLSALWLRRPDLPGLPDSALNLAVPGRTFMERAVLIDSEFRPERVVPGRTYWRWTGRFVRVP